MKSINSRHDKKRSTFCLKYSSASVILFRKRILFFQIIMIVLPVNHKTKYCELFTIHSTILPSTSPPHNVTVPSTYPLLLLFISSSIHPPPSVHPSQTHTFFSISSARKPYYELSLLRACCSTSLSYRVAGTLKTLAHFGICGGHLIHAPRFLDRKKKIEGRKKKRCTHSSL